MKHSKSLREDAVSWVQDAEAPSAALVGYITPEDADTAAALEACRNKLPRYMVPSAIVPLPDLPRLGNGKVSLSCCVAASAAVPH